MAVVIAVAGVMEIAALAYALRAPSEAGHDADALPGDAVVATPSASSRASSADEARDWRDSGFDVVLWDEPAIETKPEIPVEVVLPVAQLQLVAITIDSIETRAALYDPAQDRLHLVTRGDRVCNHTVTAIGSDTVSLSDGVRRREIRLKKGGEP